MTPDQEIARTKRLVSAARAMYSGEVGITIGAFAVCNRLSALGDDWHKRYPVFEEYKKSLPMDMPVGTERLYWNPERVLETDQFLAKAEYDSRSKLLETCVEIINEYG